MIDYRLVFSNEAAALMPERNAQFASRALYCGKVVRMFFANGHTRGLASDENAIMSAHFAAKCTGEAAAAVMSQHVAQQSIREGFGNRIFYRYF